jgi:type VI secretion system secreted protein VgrG
MSLLDSVAASTGGLTSGLPDLSGLTSMLSSFASAFAQTTRIVKLNFAAGSDIPANLLLPHRLTGHETINEGFRFQLEGLSSDADIELKRFLGVPIEITLLTDSGTEREICGIVTEASQVAFPYITETR